MRRRSGNSIPETSRSLINTDETFLRGSNSSVCLSRASLYPLFLLLRSHFCIINIRLSSLRRPLLRTTSLGYDTRGLPRVPSINYRSQTSCRKRFIERSHVDRGRDGSAITKQRRKSIRDHKLRLSEACIRTHLACILTC